ncbi:hypothetical protein ACUXHP_002642 [Staphylococcus cohnii]|nr:hypothetical protein BDW31_1405 [Staphylococcus sp. AtHG25]COT19078.1 Uncharacterised protein [Streptococcus pneumoniae]SUM81317.1 Uncharacterised protein [Staphylococcus cohnii]
MLSVFIFGIIPMLVLIVIAKIGQFISRSKKR